MLSSIFGHNTFFISGTADAYEIISKQNNLLEDLNASICKLNESIIILTREISDLKSENSQNLLFNF
jgi:cell division protein FtsB